MSKIVTCPICGKSFESRKKAKYCSDWCRQVARAQKQKAWREAHPDYYIEWKKDNPNYYRKYFKAYRKAQKEREEAINKLIKKENRND